MPATGYLERRADERERLAAAREKVRELAAQGHTLTSAAHAAGVSKSTVWKWLRQADATPARLVPRRPVTSSCRSDAVLDAQPLADWLNELIVTRYDDLSHAARALGLDESYLRKLLEPAPGARMTLAVADRIITASGDVHMLSILYPLDDEQEAAA